MTLEKNEKRNEIDRTAPQENPRGAPGDSSVPSLDTELMVRFQRGDLEAYEELVHRYTPQVINLTFRYIQDTYKAEDLAQEVFLRVFRARDSYTPLAKFSTWLYRIVVNLSLNSLRDSREEVSLSAQEGIWEEGGEEGPLSRMEKRELKEEILRILSLLPPNQRMVVILNKYEGLGVAEMAELMDLSLTAVKSLLHRARQKIKEKLTPYLQQGIPQKDLEISETPSGSLFKDKGNR